MGKLRVAGIKRRIVLRTAVQNSQGLFQKDQRIFCIFVCTGAAWILKFLNDVMITFGCDLNQF
jgi:hypothetical protein